MTVKFYLFQVVVEGNIGVGKSTFLEHLRKTSHDVEIYAEPVALWKDIEGFNALVSEHLVSPQKTLLTEEWGTTLQLLVQKLVPSLLLLVEIGIRVFNLKTSPMMCILT